MMTYPFVINATQRNPGRPSRKQRWSIRRFAAPHGTSAAQSKSTSAKEFIRRLKMIRPACSGRDVLCSAFKFSLACRHLLQGCSMLIACGPRSAVIYCEHIWVHLNHCQITFVGIFVMTGTWRANRRVFAAQNRLCIPPSSCARSRDGKGERPIVSTPHAATSYSILIGDMGMHMQECSTLTEQ